MGLAANVEFRANVRPAYGVVVIGASAGGFHDVLSILTALPSDFACSMVVVQHLHPRFETHMAEILARRSRMPVELARDNMVLKPGVVYIAPPDLHLIVEPGVLRLESSPARNNARPAVDCTLESLAKAYKGRGVAVILSGSGRDGAAGIRAVKAAGGYTLVEDPLDAQFSSMPRAAIATCCVDEVARLSSIAGKLVALSRLSEHTQ